MLNQASFESLEVIIRKPKIQNLRRPFFFPKIQNQLHPLLLKPFNHYLRPTYPRRPSPDPLKNPTPIIKPSIHHPAKH